MQKKLTITLEKSVYDSLHQIVGREHIDKFIEDLLRPHVDLALGYRMMGQDEAREREALEWVEGTLGDIVADSRGVSSLLPTDLSNL